MAMCRVYRLEAEAELASVYFYERTVLTLVQGNL